MYDNVYIYIYTYVYVHMVKFYTILTGNAHFRQGFVHKSSCAPPSAAAPHTEDVSYGRGFRWPDDRGFPAASRQCLVGFHMSLPLLTTTYSYRCCGMINYNSTSFCCIIVYRRVTCNNPWITLFASTVCYLSIFLQNHRRCFQTSSPWGRDVENDSKFRIEPMCSGHLCYTTPKIKAQSYYF